MIDEKKKLQLQADTSSTAETNIHAKHKELAQDDDGLQILKPDEITKIT